MPYRYVVREYSNCACNYSVYHNLCGHDLFFVWCALSSLAMAVLRFFVMQGRSTHEAACTRYTYVLVYL